MKTVSSSLEEAVKLGYTEEEVDKYFLALAYDWLENHASSNFLIMVARGDASQKVFINQYVDGHLRVSLLASVAKCLERVCDRVYFDLGKRFWIEKEAISGFYGFRSTDVDGVVASGNSFIAEKLLNGDK